MAATDIFPDPLSTLNASVTALTARVAALETLDNNDYQVTGSPAVAAVAMGLRSLGRFRSDGQIELATNADPTKPAEFVIDGAAAAGATIACFGSGAKFASIGLSGISNGTRVFLGADGGFTLSSTGTKKLVQQVAVYRNGFFLFDFGDAGYWVEGE